MGRRTREELVAIKEQILNLYEQGTSIKSMQEKYHVKKNIIKQIEKITLKFKVKTGANDQVFGSVSTKQIASELKKNGIDIVSRGKIGVAFVPQQLHGAQRDLEHSAQHLDHQYARGHNGGALQIILLFCLRHGMTSPKKKHQRSCAESSYARTQYFTPAGRFLQAKARKSLTGLDFSPEI